jgi:hypothetical protein
LFLINFDPFDLFEYFESFFPLNYLNGKLLEILSFSQPARTHEHTRLIQRTVAVQTIRAFIKNCPIATDSVGTVYVCTNKQMTVEAQFRHLQIQNYTSLRV